jgi:hypothetical protein
VPFVVLCSRSTVRCCRKKKKAQKQPKGSQNSDMISFIFLFLYRRSLDEGPCGKLVNWCKHALVFFFFCVCVRVCVLIDIDLPSVVVEECLCVSFSLHVLLCKSLCYRI